MSVCVDTNIWIRAINDESAAKYHEQLIDLGNDIVVHPAVRLELLLSADISESSRRFIDGFVQADLPMLSYRQIDDVRTIYGLSESGLNLVDIQIVIDCVKHGYVLWTEDENIKKQAEKLSLKIFENT